MAGVDAHIRARLLVEAEIERQQELLAEGRLRYSLGHRINDAERLAILVEEVAEACAEIYPSQGLAGDARRIHLERMAANLTAAGNLARSVNDLKAPPTTWVPAKPELLAEVVQVAAVAIAWASALIAEGAA